MAFRLAGRVCQTVEAQRSGALPNRVNFTHVALLAVIDRCQYDFVRSFGLRGAVGGFLLCLISSHREGCIARLVMRRLDRNREIDLRAGMTGITAMERGRQVVWGRFQVHFVGLVGRRIDVVAGVRGMVLGLKIGLGRSIVLGKAELSIRGTSVSHAGSLLVCGGAITGDSRV